MTESVDGVQVIRVYVPNVPRKLVLLRGLEHFWLSVLFSLGALSAEEHDVTLIYSPPLPLGLVGYLLRKLRGTPFVVNIQDLFPKEAVDLGLLKNPVIIKVFEAIERFIYTRADSLTVHSPGNKEHVVSRGAKSEKVHVVPNWVDTEAIKPLERENSFRTEHRIGNAFVVSFAGTLGFCQDLDVILRAAEILKDNKDILWLIVGEGPRKAAAEEKAKRSGLTSNVKFLPMQPREKYPLVLASSDVCLVALDKSLRTPVVPSRMLSIMASARPVVALLNRDSDAWRIVQDAQCGFCLEAGKADLLAQAILRLYQDKELRVTMGENGRRYAETYFSREICASKYEQIFRELFATQGQARGRGR